MTDSCGRRSKSARATVSPPIPESNTPSGALFMHWDAHADATWKCADLEVGREIAQVGRDVGLGAGKEMIEDPQHQPVLHLLPLELKVFRMNRLEVVRFLLRFERHHGGDAFPCHERRAGHRTIGRRLAPAGEDERAQERAHGPDSPVQRICWEDDVARVRPSRTLRYKSARRHDCKSERQSDRVPTGRRAVVHSHCATRTFNLPRSNSTVHSFTPGSRNSPSTCRMSGCSGARTVSLAVLIMATSRIFTCVPRITRGMARRNRGSDTRRIMQTSILPSAGSASGAKR